MKLIDFVYFILYKTYEGGNKTTFGAFLLNSLMFSLFQAILLLILMSLITLSLGKSFLLDFKQDSHFYIPVILLLVVNQIYLNVGNRKHKIKTRFNLDYNKWVQYAVLFFIIFSISAILGAYLANKAYFS